MKEEQTIASDGAGHEHAIDDLTAEAQRDGFYDSDLSIRELRPVTKRGLELVRDPASRYVKAARSAIADLDATREELP
jgi:hypothetical protein